MKRNEKIQTFLVKPGKTILTLNQIFPIGRIEGIRWENATYYVDHIPVQPNSEGVVYANRIEMTVVSGSEAVLYAGQGYEVAKDEAWCSWFARHQGWSGGDGIYSFNITDGTDKFDQKPGFLNLFTFGDTFVGRTDWTTRRRYDPLVMVNNSIGFHEHGKDKVRFEFNQTEKGSVCSFVKIDSRLDVSGTIPQNLVSYNLDKPTPGWVSGFNPKKIWLTFDLQIPQAVDAIRIHNYYHPASPTLASRGVRIFRLLSSMDGKNWDDLGEYELPMAVSLDDSHTIAVATTARFFKFDIQPQPGIGNYEDDYHEGVFALSKVEFLKGDFLYRDIVADASSILS
ncbi:MAG TPA: discoidin domain-containing protein, partial [Candidatus Izemoplasmatales bacterium]|nr:discoidin domain-containing protein [Candidatus Izemoplasmatales bacterium]